jgi:hypothetical protein
MNPDKPDDPEEPDVPGDEEHEPVNDVESRYGHDESPA